MICGNTLDYSNAGCNLQLLQGKDQGTQDQKDRARATHRFGQNRLYTPYITNRIPSDPPAKKYHIYTIYIILASPLIVGARNV